MKLIWKRSVPRCSDDRGRDWRWNPLIAFCPIYIFPGACGRLTGDIKLRRGIYRRRRRRRRQETSHPSEIGFQARGNSRPRCSLQVAPPPTIAPTPSPYMSPGSGGPSTGNTTPSGSAGHSSGGLISSYALSETTYGSALDINSERENPRYVRGSARRFHTVNSARVRRGILISSPILFLVFRRRTTETPPRRSVK